MTTTQFSIISLLVVAFLTLSNGTIGADVVQRNSLPPLDYTGLRLNASVSLSRKRAFAGHSADTHNYYHGTFMSANLARQSIATVSGAVMVGLIGELDDRFLFAIPIGHSAVAQIDSLYTTSTGALTSRSLTSAPWAPLDRRSWTARKNFTDPGFGKQFHLYNATGPDMNVMAAWDMNVNGNGSTVAIVDDGLYSSSPDLMSNFYAAGSYDFNARVASPDPKSSSETHGTRCAGLAGGSANTTCGVGVAYNTRLAGIRILGGALSSADMAAAMNYDYQNNQIYSCSWGPSDDGQTVEDLDSLTLAALANGVTKGRSGLGSIYVFASGNGGLNNDSCGYDGVSSNIYSMSVAALDNNDVVAYFGERCAALFVSTYGINTYTSDVGSTCASGFSGTSASAPIVSGSVALLLQHKPAFTWRDVHDVYRKAAVPVGLNTSDSRWETLPGGLMYSDAYGYGKVDVGNLLTVASSHQLLGAYASETFGSVSVNSDMVYNVPLQSNYSVALSYALKVERVSATVTLSHSSRGYLKIMLISPSNVTSVLAYPRSNDVSADGLNGFTFHSVKHWGEAANGNWTLSVLSTVSSDFTGNLQSWSLSVYGEGNRPMTTTTTTTTTSASTSKTSTLSAASIALISVLAIGVVGAVLVVVIKKLKPSHIEIRNQQKCPSSAATLI